MNDEESRRWRKEIRRKSDESRAQMEQERRKRISALGREAAILANLHCSSFAEAVHAYEVDNHDDPWGQLELESKKENISLPDVCCHCHNFGLSSRGLYHQPGPFQHNKFTCARCLKK
jgi:hypothetical protein